jgi:hypothetical protein
MMEELYLLRELCATQDEKYKERMTQLERELVTFKNHVENLQCLVRESEDRENKLIKKVSEKAQAQKQMRYCFGLPLTIIYYTLYSLILHPVAREIKFNYLATSNFVLKHLMMACM